MAKLMKLVLVLLVVLPALIIAETEELRASSNCRITVSAKLKSGDRKVNNYDATITNVGSAAAANIYIKPSVSLKSVTGLLVSGRGYALPAAQASAGGITAGSTFAFSYSANKGDTVKWSVSCTDGGAANPTSAPTTKPTSAATAAPATATTKAPTSAPAATKAPTSAPTTTKAPTSAPTTTKAPTSAPTTTTKAGTTAPSTGGKICPSGTWWLPAPQTTWQWQLTGTVDTSLNVQMYDIDLFDASASLIQSLHSKGKVVICYFSTQYENWRPDASQFTSAVLGNNLDDWAGERYVDIRSSVVRSVMSARLDIAVSKGCDGVEPDNVDGYQASTGFPLKAADQLDYNKYLAAQAHSRGLSIGLKNDLSQSKELEPYFDWALNEQCKEYNECNDLSNFITAGKAVFNTEYSGSASSLCPYMVGIKFSSLLKSLDLGAAIKAQCCTYQSNGCAAATYRCVSSPSKKRNLQAVQEFAETNTVIENLAQESNTITTEPQETPLLAASSASAPFTSIALVVAVGLAFLVCNF